MGSQSRSFQRRVVEAAQAQGLLGDLFWYVEIEIGYGRYAPACWPGVWVPVLPVGEDWEASSHVADVLAQIFAWHNAGRGLVFRAALTNGEALAESGATWYVWGEEGPPIDRVCGVCGAVTVVVAGGWAVCECGGSVR